MEERKNSIRHKITKTEVNYGRIFLRKVDGSEEFFSTLPTEFNMKVRGRNLYNKHVTLKKISIGDDVMSKFQEGEIVNISWDGEIVTIE